MKTTIKFVLSVALCFGCVTITGCSKDDTPFDTPTKPDQPNNPNPDDNPVNPIDQIAGTWTQQSASFGISTTFASTSSVEFNSSGSVKISWTATGEKSPYSTVTGTFTVHNGTLKIQWSNVTTDGMQNDTFKTFYLSGDYTVSGNTMSYSYSVYDSANTKLSGPHSASFKK